MKTRLTIMTILALALGTGIVSAFPLFPGVGVFEGTQFEDDDIDFHINNDEDVRITVGDYLVAAVEAYFVNDVLGPLDPAHPYDLNESIDELVAWTAVEVASIDPDTGAMSFIPIQDNTYEYWGDGSMIQFYQGGNDLQVTDITLTLAQAYANATDGTHLWSFSFGNDADSFWTFSPLESGADDPNVVLLLGSGTNVGLVNFALVQTFGQDIFNYVALPCYFGAGVCEPGGDGLVDIIGTGTIQGGRGLTGGAFARSDVDSVVNPIPEPSTLILLGLGLLGAGVVYRRK